ncbi:MAG: Hint domain-containing protein [Hasllibacter sp.]
MPDYTIWAVGASDIAISNGGSLSGITQGDGSHLVGETITFDALDLQPVEIRDNETRFADNDGNQRLDGETTFDGVTYAGGRRVEAEYILELTDGTTTWRVVGFNINEPGSPRSYSTVEGLAFIDEGNGLPPAGVPLTVVSAAEGPNNGAAQGIEAAGYVAPCFVTGTRILTLDGEIPVEHLTIGDRVVCRDGGAKPLRWNGTTRPPAGRMASDPAVMPVRIPAHAFGTGRPARDLWVSPQHRVLLRGGDTMLLTGEAEVLAAALHLTGRRGIAQRPARAGAAYHHLLFDTHEIVWSEGLETESFLPGESTLPAIPEASRRELLALFPELERAGGPMESARPRIRRWEAEALIA